MDKDLDKLFEETKESGAKAINELNSDIAAGWMALILHTMSIIGMICLLFLDMAPVLRIIWMVLVFGYLGFLLVGWIFKLYRIFKTRNEVKSTAKTVEIMHDLMSGIDSKDA